ncbi:exocyst complex component SEC8-like isoform X1 [Cucurbita pepo subsp. pepo]|uniref:exocyst complex component SEC8-like isoform X1 n=1 Tax=Cucurbita pepo subsp. pepo TaxID=3664 RepID=UPI000C9D9C17|nr:exocyst complex component SEC8-like isoform X1 [Cucurbita pepo subsp. pepo]XP_023529697.1 exocyst complex component SEC8-like isoform X1 [Cucurbita pepo subsp. pepo]XP_023529780.1 exocyst complex component SEC8-like isoform X1 [Cucurbita pepo subsp. pepo]
MGIFDGLPVPPEKAYLKNEIARVDESWAAARFDSLPHVVHILTSKDRDGEAQILREQNDVIEEVVDEVVHTFHSGFNKAIQNYSQILRLFSESAESVSILKVDLADTKRSFSARSKQLHQLWYRSVTLRHIISLLDQIEGIAKVPGRIEKLIAEKQFYAAVQLHVQSALMLEREGLQTVGALQDVRSELTKLRGVIFYKVLEDLHAHLYNKGDYSSAASKMLETDNEVSTAEAIALALNSSQSVSRRTRSQSNQFGIHVDDGSSFDGREEGSISDLNDDASDSQSTFARVNGGDGGLKEAKPTTRQLPKWLSNSIPDEFLETIKKLDAPLHVKYLQTMIECLCMLGKVAAAGAIICQRLRPTIHDIITSKIKAYAEQINSSRLGFGQAVRSETAAHFMKGQLGSFHLPKHKCQNGIPLAGTLVAVSPVSPVMAPMGKAQTSARDLLDSVLETVVRIFENHVVVGELLEAKASRHADMNTPRSMPTDDNWNPDSEASQVTGGYTIGFAFTVLQSECQQLICEILRATPEAASADAAVQTARLASKVPSKEKRDGADDSLTFAFRFTDATISVPNEGVDLIRHGWSRKGPNVSQEGYGSAAVLPELGFYLAAAVYRPVLQFTDKVAKMLPGKYLQLGNDGLLAFMDNFVKDHFLPTMFVDYRKSIQQAISSPAAFRPRAQAAAIYNSSVERGRPVLQGLLAIDFLEREVIDWAQAMPKFSGELVKYVQTFLERTYERCRTSYMEAVLEKQSYMLIGRHDIEKLLRIDPASACLSNVGSQSNLENNSSDAETFEIDLELCNLLLNLPSIKQEYLIRDDHKLILLASLSDSLEFVADSIDELEQTTLKPSYQAEANSRPHHTRTDSAFTRDLASFAEEYRKLSIDCLKVLRIEMQLETLFHLQEMTTREYMENQDAEEPDGFIISLTAQITRRDEEMAPFISGLKRNYIFGGISSMAANSFIKAVADMKSINLFGVQQISRNSIALEQALGAIPSVNSDLVQQRLNRVRTYYELLNMPFEALLAFIMEHEHLFTLSEYINLLKVHVPGREIPPDAHDRIYEILSR